MIQDYISKHALLTLVVLLGATAWNLFMVLYFMK